MENVGHNSKAVHRAYAKKARVKVPSLQGERRQSKIIAFLIGTSSRGLKCPILACWHERTFVDDDERRFFLKAASEACGMTGWRVHAWVLMTNHDHFLIATPEAHLVSGMKWLQNAYTRRFNTRHRLWGRLFGDRYKTIFG
jgi:hypothetical protein